MKTILVAEKTTAEVRDMLREAAGKAAELVFAETQDVTREQVLDCDALLGNIKPALLEDAPRLAWVQLMSSGADVYAGHAPLKNAFTLTTATGAYGVGIAEYMVCMLLTMMKKIPTYLDQQKAGVWRDAGEVVSPMGKRVLIVGTGPIKESFQAEFDVQHLQEKVKLLGFIADEEHAALYGAAKVFVMSSVMKTEAFGIVQIEAMSTGTPVVATKIPESGVSWVNEDGVSGLNVEPEDPKALAEAIRAICENEERYATFSQGARERFKTLYQFDKMIKKIITVYENKA